MYSIQNDEPKSFWQKLKFKQIAALRRRVHRGGLICVSVIAVHSVFNSPTEKVRVKPPDEWCWKEGVWWECQEVDGKQVKDTLEPSPRPDCHGGIESWGICSRGRFLCRSDATRWQWPTNEDDASKNYNIKMVSEDTKVQKPPGCVLFGGQFLCKDAFNLHGLRCLDNATSAGICSGSEVLCCRAEECPLEPREKVPIAARQKGFPLLAFQSLIAVWVGHLPVSNINSSTLWEHEAIRGRWAFQCIDRLMQEVLGRFAQTEEIRLLTPRIVPGWKAEGNTCFPRRRAVL